MNDFRLSLIHVPKTAGSAFVGQIINIWPREFVSPHTGIGGFLKDTVDLHRYMFTAGHVFYVKIKEVLHPDQNYMTIFRDPIERIYSHWNHHNTYSMTKAKSFEEFVYSSYDSPVVHNLMAKYYTFYPEDSQQVEMVRDDREVLRRKVERLETPYSDEELYERAVKSLDEFWYIAFQDKFVEAVKKVYDEVGLPMPADTYQKELTNYKASMSDKLISDLEEFNQVDIRIYNKYRKEG
jgi:hypothetical protein